MTKKKPTKKEVIKWVATEARVSLAKAKVALEVWEQAPMVLDQVVAGKISLTVASKIAAGAKNVRQTLKSSYRHSKPNGSGKSAKNK